jgi:predicted esterase
MRLLTLLLLLTGVVAAQDYGTNVRLKIPISGDTRKGVLFIPKGLRKNEVLPLLVAIPDTRGKAFLEVGQWQQPAYDMRFAVFSVDVTTSLAKGWHPSEQLDMNRDMEAVTEGIKVCLKEAEQVGATIDTTATVMTGHSGGTYLTLWLGLRRPDLFLGICGRGVVFFKETVEHTKLDKWEPDYQMPIFIYRGELDRSRAMKDTNLAIKLLREKGYKKVTTKVVPNMGHESKPEIFLEWYEKLLKDTARGRKDSLKITEEVKELREDAAKGRYGVYKNLAKLVERERKAGFGHAARTFYAEVAAEAGKLKEQADNLAADNRLAEAADILHKIEKDYYGLPLAKEARDERVKMIRSPAYKAYELLTKAKEMIADGKRDKAIPILEKVVEKYPDTIAAEEANALLKG